MSFSVFFKSISRIFFLVIYFCAILSTETNAQSVSSDWINYDATYFRIPVSRNSLYRIPKNQIENAGLPLSTSGFHLFYKGKEVPFYSSSPSLLADGDYLEFVGQTNDGELDEDLFRNGEEALSPYESMFTDTASFYLSWDDSFESLQFQNVENNLSSTPDPEVYFMHQELEITNNIFFAGAPIELDSANLNNPAYVSGEGYVGSLILEGNTQNYNLNTPSFYNGSEENPILIAKIIGRNNFKDISPDHHHEIIINGTSYVDDTFDGFETQSYFIEVNPTDLMNSTTTIGFRSFGDLADDDLFSVAYMDLSYPRNYDFGNSKSFSFKLQGAEAKYLEISNFNAGSNPVFYDLSKNLRISPIQEGGLSKINIPATTSNPVSNTRNCFISSTTDFFSIQTVSSLIPVNFVDFSLAENQGDFIIISHSSLNNSDPNNPVQQYAAYKESFEGGEHSCTVINIETLYDQYAWGIQKHPTAIKNFLTDAFENWQVEAKNVLIIGNGLSYNRSNISEAAYQKNLIPTFGFPASDLLFTAFLEDDPKPKIPIARIPAQTSLQVSNYLNKLVEFDELNNDIFCSDTSFWRKNTLILGQGESFAEVQLIQDQMDQIEGNLTSNGYGGFPNQFLGEGFVADDLPQSLVDTINSGVGFLSFTGQSTDNNTFWNLGIPEISEWQNAGKYPFVYALSSGLGNQFDLDDNSIAREILFTENAGGINFLAPSDLCFPLVSDLFSPSLLNEINGENYGSSVGQHFINLAETNFAELAETESEKLFNYLYLTSILLGDPSNIAVPKSKPEFEIELEDFSFFNYSNGDPILSIPLDINNQVEFLEARVQITNLGQAISDSLTFRATRWLGNGDLIPVAEKRIPSPKFMEEYFILFPNDMPEEDGFNSLIFQIDPDDLIEESCEANNTVTQIGNFNDFCFNPPTVTLGKDTIQILDGQPAITLNAGPNGSSYQWSTGETSETISALTSGNYTVTVTDEEACFTIASIFIDSYISGVNDNSNEFSGFNLFPNPFSDFVNFNLDQAAQLEIWSPDSRLIYKEQLPIGNHLLSIFDNNPSNGLYTYRISANGKFSSGKLIRIKGF